MILRKSGFSLEVRFYNFCFTSQFIKSSLSELNSHLLRDFKIENRLINKDFIKMLILCNSARRYIINTIAYIMSKVYGRFSILNCLNRKEFNFRTNMLDFINI